MKIQFKHKPYQAEAVEAVVDCFAGQPKVEGIAYRLDPGRIYDTPARQDEMEKGVREKGGRKRGQGPNFVFDAAPS
jgi:restriction endonuclease